MFISFPPAFLERDRLTFYVQCKYESVFFSGRGTATAKEERNTTLPVEFELKSRVWEALGGYQYDDAAYQKQHTCVYTKIRITCPPQSQVRDISPVYFWNVSIGITDHMSLRCLSYDVPWEVVR